MPTGSLRTICVSHETPLVPAPLIQYIIGIGNYHPAANGTHISYLDEFWHGARPLAYGAAGNYVIPRVMEQADAPTELTGIFSHRKIVVSRPLGRAAATYPVYREISPSEAECLTAEDTRPRSGCEFLVGMPIQLRGGIIGQYIDKHHAVDLFDYISIAAELKILSPADVRQFALESWFVPGGCELGIYPSKWLKNALEQLEAVGRQFVIRRADRIRQYDTYQVRAVGFLAERLGSYLLLKELRQQYPQGLSRALFGSLCVIVPQGESYQGATADRHVEQAPLMQSVQ